MQTFVCIFFILLFGISCTSSRKQLSSDASSLNEQFIANQKESHMTFDTFVEKLGSFHFSSLKTISSRQQHENICYSPLSLQLAFGMVYAGASGQTAAEIAAVLGFPEQLEQFLNHIRDLQHHLQQCNLSSDTPQLLIANKIWIEKQYQILQSYINNINHYFHGGFEQVSFSTEAEKVRQIINAWVEEQTRGTIKDFLPKGYLNEQVVMLLINAMYFKSPWKTKFNPQLSNIEKFWTEPEQSTELKFMNGKIRYARYADYDIWQVLELPYENQNFSFQIFLPHQFRNINECIPSFQQYKKAIRQLITQEVIVSMPVFRIETTLEPQQFLKDFGMIKAFTPQADLSGMCIERDLFVSKVLQKVFFECNEYGSQASSITNVIMTTTGPKPSPVRFTANRPFIFILKENTYHLPLFLGIFKGKLIE